MPIFGAHLKGDFRAYLTTPVVRSVLFRDIANRSVTDPNITKAVPSHLFRRLRSVDRSYKYLQFDGSRFFQEVKKHPTS